MNQFADTVMVEPAPARPPALTITIGPPMSPDQVELVKKQVAANEPALRARLKPHLASAVKAQAHQDALAEQAWQAGFREGFTEGRVGDRLRTWLWGAATGALVGATMALAWPLVG